MLFSPDRLRQNWQSPVVPVTELPQNHTNLCINSQYLELQRLVTEKFSDASWLSGKLADLTEKIDLSFGLDVIVPADTEQKEVIVGMLEELEELLWTMELSRQEGR